MIDAFETAEKAKTREELREAARSVDARVAEHGMPFRTLHDGEAIVIAGGSERLAVI